MIQRDYQQYAIDAQFRYFAAGGKGNPIVAMPTGTGKSVVIAGFIREAFTRWRHLRILVPVHVKELVQQNYDKMLAYWPAAPAGIYSAGIGRKDTHGPITFAGIASLVKAAPAFGHIDIVIIDECHLVSPKEATMYQSLIEQLRSVNPAVRAIGYTATHYRLGQGDLTDGGLFTDVCVDMTEYAAFNWFFDQGYLVPPIPRATHCELSVEGVRIQHGEYNLADLQERSDRREVTVAAVQEMIAQAHDREHWLVFASGVQHTLHTCEILNDLGVPATAIHSEMPDAERDKRLEGYRAGHYRAIVNNGILTTGFDFPALDMIALLRATVSPGLLVQMIGRITRPRYAPGFDLSTAEGRLAAIAASPKRNGLVLDFAGNTRRLGPINDPVRPKRKGSTGSGEAPVKLCEACSTYNHASARICCACAAEFSIATKFKGRAFCDELLRRDKPDRALLATVVTATVDSVVYKTHAKPGKRPSLQLTYHCGLSTFREWWCFDHTGFASHKAHGLWRASALTRAPSTVAEAFLRVHELRKPKTIDVLNSHPYPEIKGHAYE